MELPKKPAFEPIKPEDVLDGDDIEFCSVLTPQHRLTPPKKAWKTQIYEAIRNEMKIDIHMNLKAKRDELHTLATLINV